MSTTVTAAAAGVEALHSAAGASTAQRSAGQNVDHAATAILNFADVPSDLFQLRTLNCETNSQSLHHTTAAAAAAQKSGNDCSLTVQGQQQNNEASSALPTPLPSPSLSATTSTSTPSSAQTRKPSPGLAARLKALGFGTSRKSSPPPPPQGHHQSERVGRLSEAKLRNIDHNHIASPISIVVEKRGRPWKSNNNNVPQSGASTPTTEAHERLVEVVERSSPLPPPTPQLPRTPSSVVAVNAAEAEVRSSPFLPVIEASQPLDMDTHKYRLPDHTNGNGTKVQLETRHKHLGRDMYSPSGDVASMPPPPPPKDSPPPPPANSQNDYVPDKESYFNPFGLQRPGSIYTLSRASFANQLAQLTSLQLPDAESLSGRLAAIPTAQAAASALIGAADQIKSWISKASEVIGGLDSDDDVEWAAAGGREGLAEVENAIARFQELINVYVNAIDEINGRPDIESVNPEHLTRAVMQMDSIMEEWHKIKATLNNVKAQVEIAMEWEELWNMVLGDIQGEMDELSRLVFEMEERRHKSLMAAASNDGVDIGDLETIVEDTPPHGRPPISNRFSIPSFPLSPSSPGPPTFSQDDSSILALFARMQPLRASLDFLPMRLSSFEYRAEKLFPTACEELDMRRTALDNSYKKLEKDAESLRKELGEDRWVTVFRGAGRQAQKMYESVERSVAKLKEAVDTGMHLTNQVGMGKKIESYESKKTHYGPAIERILLIIDKGVKDRLTVNGEILRLYSETQAKWEHLKEQMREMDATLEELHADKRNQQLRDSISSMLSNDRSTIASGNDTPGSSPPSSVIMSSLGFDPKTPTATAVSGAAGAAGAAGGAPATGRNRAGSSGASHLPQPASSRRVTSMPTPTSQLPPPRKGLTSRLSTLGLGSMAARSGAATPTGNRLPRPASMLDPRPRWNSSTNTTDTGIGHNFKPMSLTNPSPYARGGATTPGLPRSVSAMTARESKLPTRSPLSRAASSSPIPEDTPTPSRSTSSRLAFRDRLTSPGPYAQQAPSNRPVPTALQQKPAPRLASQASMSALNRRASMQPPSSFSREASTGKTGGGAAAGGSRQPSRPASSLATSRRVSLLPQPRSKAEGGGEAAAEGRTSPQAVAGARAAFRKSASVADQLAKDAANKPKWRG